MLNFIAANIYVKKEDAKIKNSIFFRYSLTAYFSAARCYYPPSVRTVNCKMVSFTRTEVTSYVTFDSLHEIPEAIYRTVFLSQTKKQLSVDHVCILLLYINRQGSCFIPMEDKNRRLWSWTLWINKHCFLGFILIFNTFSFYSGDCCTVF